MREGQVQSEAPVRILPAPDLHSVDPDSHHLLGVTLDQHGRCTSQDQPRCDHGADHGYTVVRYIQAA